MICEEDESKRIERSKLVDVADGVSLRRPTGVVRLAKEPLQASTKSLIVCYYFLSETILQMGVCLLST
jgi:hypothetical protein